MAWVPWASLWFVTTWEHCLAVGTDRERFRGATDHPTLERVFGAPNALTTIDPEHADLRVAVDPPLRPRAVNGYIDELARPIVRRHLQRIRRRGEAEIMSELLEPVSVEALGELYGLGVDADTLRRWVAELNVRRQHRVRRRQVRRGRPRHRRDRGRPRSAARAARP